MAHAFVLRSHCPPVAVVDAAWLIQIVRIAANDPRRYICWGRRENLSPRSDLHRLLGSSRSTLVLSLPIRLCFYSASFLFHLFLLLRLRCRRADWISWIDLTSSGFSFVRLTSFELRILR